MSDTKNANLFPKNIKVKGLPFMLQGWNNIYKKTDEISDNCPIYRLEEYNLYWIIPIIGVRIFREDGVWKMQRDCDFFPLYGFNKYGFAPQGDPFGYWSNNIYVQPA
jgi:hypothetical protein